MNTTFHLAARAAGRFIFFCTMRCQVLHAERADRAGGYLLALTHLGHLDPLCASVLLRRPIRWMARREFFKYRPVAALLRWGGAFSVNRQGIPVSSIRRAIELARQGNLVGICPEGGRTYGDDTAVLGGRIKRGVCSVAIRSGVPVVPCVMLGTPDLSRVGPWLPFKHGRIWVAYGEPLTPPPPKSNRQKRDAFRDQLSASYQQLFRELCQRYGLDEGRTVPPKRHAPQPSRDDAADGDDASNRRPLAPAS